MPSSALRSRSMLLNAFSYKRTTPTRAFGRAGSGIGPEWTLTRVLSAVPLPATQPPPEEFAILTTPTVFGQCRRARRCGGLRAGPPRRFAIAAGWRWGKLVWVRQAGRSEEHTSELQ